MFNDNFLIFNVAQFVFFFLFIVNVRSYNFDYTFDIFHFFFLLYINYRSMYQCYRFNILHTSYVIDTKVNKCQKFCRRPFDLSFFFLPFRYISFFLCIFVSFILLDTFWTHIFAHTQYWLFVSVFNTSLYELSNYFFFFDITFFLLIAENFFLF